MVNYYITERLLNDQNSLKIYQLIFNQFLSVLTYFKYCVMKSIQNMILFSF